jgi:hypothetical protein
VSQQRKEDTKKEAKRGNRRRSGPRDSWGLDSKSRDKQARENKIAATCPANSWGQEAPAQMLSCAKKGLTVMSRKGGGAQTQGTAGIIES